MTLGRKRGSNNRHDPSPYGRGAASAPLYPQEKEVIVPKYSTGLLIEFAPHITELTECNIPGLEELKTTSSNWVHSFIMNSFMAAKYPPPMHQYALVFLRKAESSFQEFYFARNSLSSYITTQILHNDRPSEQISQYFAMLHRFEVLISQIYQAYMVYEKFLILDDQKRLWSKGDGSVLEKINTLYNFIKHAEGKINNTSTEPGYLIWLTNSGVSCKQGDISFIEIAEALKDLAENATYYCNPYKVIKDIEAGAFTQ